MPEQSGLCVTCFYYKNGRDGKWFWSREGDYLFPYNIGRRMMDHMDWDRSQLENPKVNWREYLRSQKAGRH